MDGLPLFSHTFERRDPAHRKHGGNESSNLAHRKALGKKRYFYSRILILLRQAGSTGRTAKELARMLGVGFNQISGRCTELVQMGFVRRLAIRRDGSAVLIHRKY
ncbi:MAG: hypothetical protein JNJ77_19910 [Planctomycetia bacterium]|nr:hypothetical protein [Planctomycetia bacterium]